MVAVSRLSIAVVKGTQLRDVDEIHLGPTGVRENRRFYLIDDQNEMVNSLRLGELQTAVFTYHDERRHLKLQLPDGQTLEEKVAPGSEVATRFYSETKTARLVNGPWSEVLSDLAGKALRLVEAGDEGAVDRGLRGAVSLISEASLERLAQVGGLGGVDARRFRMLIEVSGLEAHAEDAWVGSAGRLGEALVGFEG